MNKKYFYLVHIQYLGFRFHGWAKQPGVKTVHGLIDKTLRFVLGHDTRFKTMGTSRTDALVSANHNAFELFVYQPITNLQWFVDFFNENLPTDIRVLKVEPVTEKFNILNTAKTKTYEYVFAYGTKPHPFLAPHMAFFPGHLDIGIMQEGAQLFAGTHNFGAFVTKPSENTRFIREILTSHITQNTKYTSGFFPKTSFIYTVSAKGFMRNQVRLMMGQLVELGRGNITLQRLEEMLKIGREKPLTSIAPASGLILDTISFGNY